MSAAATSRIKRLTELGSGTVSGMILPAMTASGSSCASRPNKSAPGLLASPIRLLSVLDIAADHLGTSDTLSIVNDGRRLASEFAGIDFRNDIEDYKLRVQDVHEPVRWSLELTADPHNQRVLDVFRGIGWDDVVESRVKVLVTGEARHRLAAELSELGFDAEAAGGLARWRRAATGRRRRLSRG